MKEINGWKVPDRDTYFAPFLEKEDGFQLDHLERAILRCRDTRMAVDGGANIGTWTCSMAARFQHVWAFEPVPDTYECLSANVASPKTLEAFQRNHRITTLREALSDRNGYGEVRHDPTRKGNTGSDWIATWRDGQKGDKVRTRRLDDLGLNCLDLLKLDLEGHEYFALRGGKKTILECRPVVIMESVDKGCEADRYGIEFGKATLLLESWGYEMMEYIRPDAIFVPK